jgi:hypothetical protein
LVGSAADTVVADKGYDSDQLVDFIREGEGEGEAVAVIPPRRNRRTRRRYDRTIYKDRNCIERLRRSVKYEEVYLHGYTNGTEVRASLAKYFSCYNARRSHQSHEYRTPDEVYFEALAASTPMAA